MDYYNRLKSFLGLPYNANDRNVHNNSTPIPKSGTERDNTSEPDVPDDHRADEYERFGFNIFSHPLEMHRYFEHQMNEIMKSFGIFHNGESFFGNTGESLFGKFGEPFFGDNSFNYDPSQFPQLEDYHKENDQKSGTLRDQYLKPGYEHPKPSDQVKTDVDIDGRFDMGDLDTVLRGKRTEIQPRTYVFGQSVISKTVRNADGTMETQRTMTDQHGNQEVTITRRQGNKEYTRTTRTGKDGHQEITENFVNMDEKDKNALLGHTRLQDGSDNESLPPNWFPFDKFFK